MNKKCYLVLSIADLNRLLREARKDRSAAEKSLNRRKSTAHCVILRSTLIPQADGGMQVSSAGIMAFRSSR
jgi:hypothetical protein